MKALPFCTLILVALVACSDIRPECPAIGGGDQAPSAGCFAVRDGKLLLVQGFNGKVSLPGGSSEVGETAQCTAFRETWEETGLQLQPRELMRVFDTGFHLYNCAGAAQGGEFDRPTRFEVRDVFFLGPEQFADYQWRFEDQRGILVNMLLKYSGGLE